MYLVASGLSPINDRVQRVTDRIEDLKNALASDESSRYILSGDSTSYEALSARRQAEKRAKMPEEINTNDIFKKFMNPGGSN